MTLIQRLDGTTYDLLDYGIKTRNVLISSPTPEHVFENAEGRNGVVDHGTTYDVRYITGMYRATSKDIKDFSLLRDEIFMIFRTDEPFYLIEKRLPGKRWLVKVEFPYEIPQKNIFGNFDVNFIGIKGVSESVGTSADIDNPELMRMVPNLWTQGYYVNIVGGTGTNTNSRSVRMNKKIKVLSGINYVIKNSSSIADLKVSFFNNAGYKRRITIDPTEKTIIEIDNDVIEIGVHFSTSDVSGDDIKPEDIDGTIKGKLKKEISGIVSDDELWGFGMGLIADDDSLIYTHTNTSFKIFNPGIEVHPFEQDLLIEISDVKGSTDYLQLKNQTTGDIFKVTEAVNDNQLIKLDGPNITSNNLQYLRKTNRKYITLAPGWNEFRLTGADSAKVSFDFRFYYL